MVTAQVPVPVQAPLQPVKVEPAAAVAVSVTEVSLGTANEQVVPQSMPGGELVTEPEPEPAFVTVRVCVGTPTSPRASTAKLVATTSLKSSRSSTGHEPFRFCSVSKRSTTFAYQFAGFDSQARVHGR